MSEGEFVAVPAVLIDEILACAEQLGRLELLVLLHAIRRGFDAAGSSLEIPAGQLLQLADLSPGDAADGVRRLVAHGILSERDAGHPGARWFAVEPDPGAWRLCGPPRQASLPAIHAGRSARCLPDAPAEPSRSAAFGVRDMVAIVPTLAPGVAKDFLDARRKARKPLTETGFRRLVKQANGAGWSATDALAECLERGWQGFKAEWVEPRDRRGSARGPLPSKTQQNSAALAAFLGEGDVIDGDQ